MPCLAAIPSALAAASFLALPFALWLHAEAHLSQGLWLVFGLAGVLTAAAATASRNPGAGGLLLLSAGWVLACCRQLGGVPAAALWTHLHLWAGVLCLALLPLIFRGRRAWALNLLRIMALIWAAWWMVEALGLDPILKAVPGRGMPDGLRGNCLGSPVLLGAMLGAALPLFVARGWHWCLVLIVPAWICQGSMTGYLAGAASVHALAVCLAWERHGRTAVTLAGVLALIWCAGLAVTLNWHHGPGADHRVMLWAEVLRGADLLGHGPGSWGLTLGKTTGHASPYSAYALVLWEYGWLGLGLALAGAGWILRRAWSRITLTGPRLQPELFGATVGVLAAAGGTMVFENAASAAWAVLLFACAEMES